MANNELPKAVRDKLARMASAFDKIDRLLFRLGLQGLQRMTSTSATELLALQQTAHNAALITIEREIDKLATHVQRYLDKDPLFTMSAYVGTLNRIWLLNNKARELHAAGKLPDEMIDVIGETRRSYELVEEPLTLQPLGATGWVTDTDFVGITIYFYVDGKPDTILQATSCKPTMYFGNDPRRLMRMPISDYVTETIYDMAHGAFEFVSAKLSRDGRMSLHKDLLIRKAPYIGGRAYDALAVADWAELLHRLRAKQIQPVTGFTGAEVFIEPDSWGELVVDDKNARAVADLGDAHGAKLQIEVPLREENNFLVDNLERMLGKKRKVSPNALFGRASLAEGRLKFFPYTAIFNQAVVLQDRGKQRVNEIHLALENLGKVKEG